MPPGKDEGCSCPAKYRTFDCFILGGRVSLLGRLGWRNAACVSHRNGDTLASAAQGRSIPADGYKILNSNLPHLHIKISILTKNAVFRLILHSVPWSALKCHQGEDWPL